jgi:excisionase family DNA binding protein
MLKNEKTFTTFDIAGLLDVYPTTVANWIDSSKLSAYTTPGGHRRVKKMDFLAFLKKYKMPVPKDMQENIKKRVLIVDDDESTINSITKVLNRSEEQYKIETAANGFQAGHALYSFSPHLVILDIMLPGIDGFNVCNVIKQLNEKIKVIAITGYDSDENKIRILEAGADAYLPKPFEIKELKNQVIKMLDS